MYWSWGIVALWLTPLLLGLPLVLGAMASPRFRAWLNARMAQPDDDSPPAGADIGELNGGAGDLDERAYNQPAE